MVATSITCARNELRKVLCLGVSALSMPAPRPFIWKSPNSGFAAVTRKASNANGRPAMACRGRRLTVPLMRNGGLRSSNISFIARLAASLDYVQDYNRRSGRKVRCYVRPTASSNYAHWGSSAPNRASRNSMDAMVTSPSVDRHIAHAQYVPRSIPGADFRNSILEYGRCKICRFSLLALGKEDSNHRTVWFLNDPVEDNGNHDWKDYRSNWESTLVASLLHPEVWQYEVAPCRNGFSGALSPASPA